MPGRFPRSPMPRHAECGAIVFIMLGLALGQSDGDVLAADEAELGGVATWAIPVRAAGAEGFSERFLREAEAARQSIPERLWQSIRRAGWRFYLAEFVVDAVPDLKHSRPRGWPAKFTWNHTDAAYLPRSRRLVLAEKRRRVNGEVVESDRVGGVFRHELGHAFDMICSGAYRYRSASPAFQRVYREDVARLTAEQRDQVVYYLQGRYAGRQEAFAEAFGVLLGGGSDVTKRTQFEQAFPSVLEFVEREIESYRP
jgi:hypothetical protein